MTSVLLRPATERDAQAIHDIYRPIVVDSTISFEIDPPSLEEIRARIRSGGRTHPWLVCTLGEEVAGYAYASPFRSRPAYGLTAEVSVYAGDSFRRRGVARALYEALLGLLELQRYHTAIAVIALPNEASLALHEAFGFGHAGTLAEVGFKKGQVLDVDLWQFRLAEIGERDAALPFDDVIAGPEWAQIAVRAAGRVKS